MVLRNRSLGLGTPKGVFKRSNEGRLAWSFWGGVGTTGCWNGWRRSGHVDGLRYVFAMVPGDGRRGQRVCRLGGQGRCTVGSARGHLRMLRRLVDAGTGAWVGAGAQHRGSVLTRMQSARGKMQRGH